MIKFFHIFVIIFLILSSSHTFDARIVDPTTLDKIHYQLKEPEFKGKHFLTIHNRNPEYTQSLGEATKKNYVRGESPFSYIGGLRKPFSQNFEKYPISDNNIGFVEADSNQENQISSSEYDDKLSPKLVAKWIEKTEDISPPKWRRYVHKKMRKKRYGPRRVDSGKTKRYLDYTNSQMPFNEGQKHQQKKGKISQFVDKASKNDKTSVNNLKDPLDFEMKRERLGKRMSLPLRSQEKNFEMLQDDSDSDYSRVRRYLDHKRVKKRIRMTSTLEAKEAALSRVLDPNLNLDGILEPHVRKRRGSRKEN